MSTENWTLILKPKTGWFDIHLGELWRYRDLIALFVRRDFVAIYKQTVLGPLWFLIQPLFTTLIFTIIFGRIAKIPTDGVPPFLFYMAGNVAWVYFADCLTGTSNTFVQNAGIFGKVYFPRLTVPLAKVITDLLKFGIQLTLFLGFLAYFRLSGADVHFSGWIFYLPLLILQMALLGLGFGILISSMTTKYRDLTFLVAFGMQLWMYATPVVYPLSQIPEQYRALYMLNPMASVVESFRMAFLGVGSIQPSHVFLGWAVTVVVLFTGIVLFSRIEKTFMDTV